MKRPAPHHVPVIVAALAITLAPWVFPTWVVSLLGYVGLYSIVCLGLVLLTGWVGITSFGQAAFVGLAAYVSALAVTQAGLSPWASLPLSLLVTALTGWLLGWLTIRLSGHYLVLGTMAWGLGLYYLFGNLQGLGGFNGIAGVPRLAAGGLSVADPQVFMLLVWAIAGLLLAARGAPSAACATRSWWRALAWSRPASSFRSSWRRQPWPASGAGCTRTSLAM
jgi:branched-chain amino acid transport system permease protein